MMVLTCDPRPWELETGGWGVQGHPWLHTESEAAWATWNPAAVSSGDATEGQWFSNWILEKRGKEKGGAASRSVYADMKAQGPRGGGQTHPVWKQRPNGGSPGKIKVWNEFREGGHMIQWRKPG